MKKVLFLTIICLFCGSLFGQEAASSRRKIYFNLQGNYSSIGLGPKTFNEMGVEPSVGFFPFKRLAIFGSYFAVAKPDGSSNLNGLGFSGRYYFISPGAEVNLSSLGTTVLVTPGIVPYAGLEYLERNLKASALNINFTGFSLLFGGDWHFHRKWYANAELSYGSLKNSLSSAAVQDLKLMTLGVAIGLAI